MKNKEAGELTYAEPCKPIGPDGDARHDDNSGIMVHVSSDRYGPMNIQKYFKGYIEKSIELKYRRFAFSTSEPAL